MQHKGIEIFYLFFQGILIFQALIFIVLYFLTGRKDLMYYDLFLFFAAAYFFICFRKVKTKVTISFLFMVCCSVEAFAQTQISYVDSAIFYLNKSRSDKYVDSLTFAYGIKLIDSINTDETPISRIDRVALGFKKMKDKKFYYQIEYALVFRLQIGQKFYRQIDFGKRILAEYEQEGDTAYKKYYCDILHSLRVPFRSTDKINEGFDYYADKLKTYFPRNDSEIIAICYFVYGGFYLIQGLGDRSAYYLKKCISYLNPKDTNDKTRIGLRTWVDRTGTLAFLYNRIENYEEAAIYARVVNTVSLINPSRNDSMNRSLTLRYFAEAKMMLNEKDSVLPSLDESLKLALIVNSNENIAGNYEVKGRHFLLLNRQDSAEKYLLESKKVIEQNGLPRNSPWGIITPNYYLAQIRIKQKKFSDAEKLILTEIPLLVNLNREVLKEKKLLVSIYMAMDDIKKAKETYQDYVSMQEELSIQDQNNRVTSFEHEQKLEDLSKEKTIKEMELAKQKKQKTFYVTGSILLALLSFFVLLNFRNEKKINRLMDKAHAKEKRELELQNQQSVLNERLRISRELHDEVGATLSGIAMYSHLTEEQMKTGQMTEIQKSLNVMRQSSAQMVDKLKDIVWLINPGQDSLQKLIERLEEYATDMAAIKNMKVKITVPDKIEEIKLPIDSRRNIYLFCKEAINNAVKYSGGSLLELDIQATNGVLEFSVSDNGRGFDSAIVKKGNGLENMHKRADEVGAKLVLSSKENEGTSLSLQYKIT